MELLINTKPEMRGKYNIVDIRRELLAPKKLQLTAVLEFEDSQAQREELSIVGRANKEHALIHGLQERIVQKYGATQKSELEQSDIETR